jgi:hypothetical protein
VEEAALDPTAVAIIRQIGRDARQRALALRDVPSAGSPQAVASEGEIAAAEAILAARDELVRSLSPDRYDRLEQWNLSGQRQLEYTLPVRGRLAQWDSGPMCIVSIRGRDFPYLIPEAYAWETYFRGRAIVASSQRTGPETYREEHIRTVQRHELPIAREHIVLILRVATSTNAAIDKVRQAARTEPADPHVAQQQLIRIVSQARAGLTRALPKRAWLILQADVTRTTGGTVFDFPANPKP